MLFTNRLHILTRWMSRARPMRHLNLRRKRRLFSGSSLRLSPFRSLSFLTAFPLLSKRPSRHLSLHSTAKSPRRRLFRNPHLSRQLFRLLPLRATTASRHSLSFLTMLLPSSLNLVPSPSPLLMTSHRSNCPLLSLHLSPKLLPRTAALNRNLHPHLSVRSTFPRRSLNLIHNLSLLTTTKPRSHCQPLNPHLLRRLLIHSTIQIRNLLGHLSLLTMALFNNTTLLTTLLLNLLLSSSLLTALLLSLNPLHSSTLHSSTLLFSNLHHSSSLLTPQLSNLSLLHNSSILISLLFNNPLHNSSLLTTLLLSLNPLRSSSLLSTLLLNNLNPLHSITLLTALLFNNPLHNSTLLFNSLELHFTAALSSPNLLPSTKIPSPRSTTLPRRSSPLLTLHTLSLSPTNRSSPPTKRRR